jgi:hypothetical protein
MKYLDYYKNKNISETEVFEYFTNSLRDSIKTWNYFVNWEKVNNNLSGLKISLSILNSLISSNNLEKDFKNLMNKYPEVISTFPVLLAVRENHLKIIKDYQKLDLSYLEFNFKTRKSITLDEVNNYYSFIVDSGLIQLFENKNITNFIDYVTGVEVGLDSNGRKNRGGTLMESIVETFLVKFCEDNNLEYTNQATASSIKQKWNFEVKFDKSSRRYDFAIFNGKELFLFETNFYNGSGSKLKSVCGEFKTLRNELKEQNISLIWITDGLGWKSTLRPLEETFNHNEYVFNLDMLEDGILKEVIRK